MLLLLLNMLCGNMYLVVLLFLLQLFALSWVVHSRALSCLARFLSMLQMLPVPLMLVLTVALLSREVRPIVPFRLSHILGRPLLMLTFLLLRGLVHMHLLLDHGPFGHPLPPGHDNLVRFFPGGRGVPRATMDKSFRSKSCSLVSVKRPRSFIYNDGRSPSHLHGHSSSFPFPSSLGSPQEESPSRPAFPPSFLERGVIREIFSPVPLFFSRVFIVPKKDGPLRMVIDLHILNRLLVVPHFLMESVLKIAEGIIERLWGCTINLKDAYFHVPMAWVFHQFLAFAVDGRTYVF